MRYLKDADPARHESVDDAREQPARALVELGARLVEDEVARPHGEHAGKREELLLPSRELGRHTSAQGLDPARAERLGDPLVNVRAIEAEVSRAEGHLVLHERTDDLVARVLPYVADEPRQVMRRSLADHEAVHAHAAGARCERTVQKSSERGLSRSVAAEKDHARTGGEPQRDARERRAPAVAEARIVDLYHASRPLSKKRAPAQPGPSQSPL